MMESLDSIEEIRERAKLQVAAFQQKVARYFNSKVKERKFNVGDLVLQRVFLNTRDPTAGVLGPNWEGPYQIEEVLHPGTYKLARLNGDLIPRYWNDQDDYAKWRTVLDCLYPRAFPLTPTTAPYPLKGE